MNRPVSPGQQADSWRRVEHILERDYEQPDFDGAKVIFSCVAAHRIVEYQPVWVMAVAPSGSLKTAILEGLRGLPHTLFVDEVTPQTFISGKLDDKRKKRQTPASLLHRIGSEGIMVAADFSTILSMDERNRAKILAQLRRIYDGRFCREFGTDENLSERDWQGRLTFLTGVTPDVDSHYSVFRSLGERFIQVRWARAGGIQTGIKAMEQSREGVEELQSAVHAMMTPILSQKSISAPNIDESIKLRLANLSEFVALSRAYVPRARDTHEIITEPSPEGNTRLAQQFTQLVRGSSVLAGRLEVNEADFALVRRAAFDCIPDMRRKVLSAVMFEHSPYSLGLPEAVVNRTLTDLEALRIAERVSNGRGSRLTKSASELIAGIESSPKMHMNESGLKQVSMQVGGS